MPPDRGLLYRMLAIGVPASADGTIAFVGHFCFMAIVNRVPTAFSPPVLYAAHIVGIRIESLSYLPAQAWSVAAGTMVGQNLGAGQPQRARTAAHAAVWQAAILLVGTGFFYYFAAAPLYRFLSNDPQVWKCGVPALKGLAFFQLPLAFLIVYLGALRGAGDTRTPMFVTALGMGCVRIPVALLGGFVLKGGLLGAWAGMFADITVRGILITWRFRKGLWQRIKV
jgi:MATE family multidrug resistance protein